MVARYLHLNLKHSHASTCFASPLWLVWCRSLLAICMQALVASTCAGLQWSCLFRFVMAIKHGFNLHVVLKDCIITLMFVCGSRSTSTQRVNDISTNCEGCHSNHTCMLCYVFTRIINTHGHIYELAIYVCIYIYIIKSYYIILKHILIFQNGTLMVFQKQSNLAKKINTTSIRP